MLLSLFFLYFCLKQKKRIRHHDAETQDFTKKTLSLSITYEKQNRTNNSHHTSVQHREVFGEISQKHYEPDI